MYDRAKDMDMLRFRAPEAMNAIIDGLPKKYSGVYLTDTKKIFEEHSPHGIIGNETILEHVHPNLLGYSLMSEAFYRSLKEHNIILPDLQQEITLGQLQQEMPITIVDSLKGDFEIRVLKERWPFNLPKAKESDREESYEAQLAHAMLYQKITWLKAMQNQLDYYTRRYDQNNTLKVAEASVLQIVNNPSYLQNVGKLCIEQNNTRKAKVYLQQAFTFSPLPETAQRLVILFLKDDQPEKALPYLTYLDQANRSRAIYSGTISLAKEIAGYKERLKKEPGNIGVLNLIAQDYYRMQNTNVALQYSLKAYALDKTNKETIELMEKIKSMPGQN
jgi:tetratricopeptide (TPR) repeat protein